MERAKSEVKNRWGVIASESAKVAVLVWVVSFLDPFVEQVLPKLGLGFRYLLSALVSAFVLEVVLQLVFGWPKLTIRWVEQGEPVAPRRELIARMTLRKKVTGVVRLNVTASSDGWLGHFLLRVIVGGGSVLRVELNESSLRPFVDGSSERNDADTVVPNDGTHGFDVDLGPVPRRAGEWHWARVRWEADAIPDDVPFNIYLSLHHESRVRRLLMMFVIKSSNVRLLRVIRK